MPTASTVSASGAAGFGSPAYRSYVLGALLVVYTFNFIDRVLIGVIAEPLIEEFELLDWQFGLLSGFGFALFYTFLGVPIARAAETRNRVAIIAICVALWSLMTALCGLAGSFLMLLLFRVGVGVGEAGCTPPASSLIADYFAPRSRAKALGVYASGAMLGMMLANLFGGPIAEFFSWRQAFFWLGAPGVILALVVWLTVKEPPRGYTDPPGAQREARLGFAETLRHLAGKPSYWLVTIASTLTAFIGYGHTNFTSSFLVRNHGVSVGEAAVRFNAPIALFAAMGAMLMGVVIERLSPRFPTVVAWLPGLGVVLGAPLVIAGLNVGNLTLVLVLLCLGSLFKYGFLTAQYAIAQGVAAPRARATAIAILLFVINLFGYGLGPMATGALSDALIAREIAAAGASLTLAACKGDLALLTAAQAAICEAANGDGLRLALSLTAVGYVAAGLMYVAAARTLRRDIAAG